jgi:hypothetical protein
MKHTPLLAGAMSILLCACGAEDAGAPDPQDVQSGTATLHWSVPTQNTDDSALTNLAGFRVYHGTRPDSLAALTTVTNPATTSTVIRNLDSGTHYFAVSSLTNSGAESALSDVRSKVIP